MTDTGGTFVISWDQTETDGLRAAGPEALRRGAVWRWDGPAVRIEGGPSPLLLADEADHARLRAGARRQARRMLRGAVGSPAALPEAEPADGLDMAPADGFLVSDGRRAWQVRVLGAVPARGGAMPALVFDAGVPPRGTELWIVEQRLRRGPDPAQPCAMPGIAAGMEIDTPDGPRPVSAIRAGMRVVTRDAGVQRVLWAGRRTLGPARLAALPGLRPVRLSPSLVGARAALVLGPGQGIALGGPAVAELFAVPEVLLRAADLEDRAGAVRLAPREAVTLCWLLLADRHLLSVGGAGLEAFDPAAAEPLLEPAERAAILAVAPDAFHAEAQAGAAPGMRRPTPGEARLLGRGAGAGRSSRAAPAAAIAIGAACAAAR